MDRIGQTFHQRAFALVARLGTPAQGWLLRHYFDWWHRRPDPWRLTTSTEEQQKYVKILNAVPDRGFRRILDVGCSEGTFTELAAERYAGTEAMGIDLSARALTRARGHRRRNTRFFAMNLLEEAPPGKFDLVFCSEMLYYMGTSDALQAGAERLRELLSPGGLLVVSHPWPQANRLHAPLHADRELALWSSQVDRAGSQTFQILVFGRDASTTDAAIGHHQPTG